MSILTPCAMPMRSDRLGINFGAVVIHCGLEVVKESKECWYIHDKWIATLTRDNKTRSFDYFTGIGHRAPQKAGWAEHRWQVDRAMKIIHGMSIRKTDENFQLAVEELEKGSTAVVPKIDDMLYCLVADSDACGMPFEAWCLEFGYEEDSRKAYATWKACQENGKRLLDLGVDLAAAREAFSDY